jgi:hypothetical protein
MVIFIIMLLEIRIDGSGECDCFGVLVVVIARDFLSLPLGNERKLNTIIILHYFIV